MCFEIYLGQSFRAPHGSSYRNNRNGDAEKLTNLVGSSTSSEDELLAVVRVGLIGYNIIFVFLFVILNINH